MERRHDIDWLRVFAIILVLYFHTAMIFAEERGWHIKNDELSYLWLEFNFWLSQFRMPLLFFISGYGTFLALRKRNSGRYLKERAQRLMVPLIFAMFLIVPPQIYFERVFNGEQITFLQFFPSVFELKPYPGGSFSWHHMWFVLYLFIYSAILLPIFLFLRRTEIKERIDNFLSQNSWVSYLLLVVPTITIYLTYTIHTQRTNDLIHDGGWMTYWASFFLAGYLAGVAPSMWGRIEKDTRTLVGLAIVSTLLINFIRWNRIELEGLTQISYLILLPLSGWLWLLSMLSLGKRYLNRPHPILAYANRAIYPFYIVHQTIIIVIGYYVVTLVDEGILAKYMFISTASLILSIAFYEYLIRPYRVMRFLFGVKEIKPKPKKEEVSKLVKEAPMELA